MLYNKEQVQEIIPHRGDMLLIDGIETIDEETRKIIGFKQLTGEEFWVAGHFPQEAVMPGVLICETIAQTGAVYLLSQPDNKGKIAYFARMDKVRFRRKVVPGDRLRLEVDIDGNMRMGVGRGKGKAYVGDELVCDLEMTFAVGEAE